MAEKAKEPYIPPVRRIVNVSASGASSQAIKDANEEIAVTRARRQLLEERQLTDNIVNPKKDESGFKVVGGVNLGTIDLQAERKEAKEALEREKAEMREGSQALAQELEETKAALVNIQIESIRKELQEKVTRIEQLIAGGATKKEAVSFTGMLTEIKAAAKELGYTAGGGGGTSDMVQIELAKMTNANAAADREFKRQSEKDRRDFELKLEEMKNDREMRLAELGIKQQQGNMLAKAPEMIGEALGKALAGRGGVSDEAGAITDAAPAGSLTKHIYATEAPVGESGSIPCPTQGCGAEVAVGPKAVQSICARCGSVFNITRIGVEAPPAGAKKPIKSFMDVGDRSGVEVE